MERWNKVIKLRDVVNQALETARNEKKIGKSLEAKIVLTVPAFETALDGMDADTLADILIVSQWNTKMTAVIFLDTWPMMFI